MKKQLSKTLRQLLNWYGYRLSKVQHRNEELFPVKRSFWDDFFQHAPHKFTDIFIENRDKLQEVKEWMPDTVHQNSLFRYGIPESYLGANRNSSINYLPSEFTYSDLLVFLAQSIKSPKYLEIGVSAGKNFFQIMNSLQNATMVGIDIEEMNPVLNKFLSDGTEVWSSEEKFPFEAYGGRSVNINFKLNKYNHNPTKNSVAYLRGDKFSPILWEQLQGSTFDIIFSDAFHHPESIRSEFEFLTKYDLLNSDRLTMVWDDLDKPEMQIEFKLICEQLSKSYGPKANYALYNLKGTYGGQDDGIHKIGLFRSEG